jgi:hypothetical protein
MNLTHLTSRNNSWMRRQELKEKRSSFYEDWRTEEGLRFWVSGRKIVTYSGPLDNIKTFCDNF